MKTYQGIANYNQYSASTSQRAGISLFEVLLALVIFMGSYAALSALSSSGMNAAVQGRLQTQAIIRCESKLAEVVSAVEPMDSVSEQHLLCSWIRWLNACSTKHETYPQGLTPDVLFPFIIA